MCKKMFYIESLVAGNGVGEKNYAIIKNAISECINGGFDGIMLPQGEYEVYNQRALDLYKMLITGEVSPIDYDRWNSERQALFGISDVNGIAICGDGDGTKININGFIAPFDFHRCNDILLKNITVDWITVPYTPVTVVDVNGDTVYVTPMSGYSLVGGEPVVSTTNINPDTLKQGGMAMYSDISNLRTTDKKDVFSFTCLEPEIVTVGEILILRHIYTYSPAIHFYMCKNVKVEDVRLCAAAGMGIIAQKTKDIIVNRFTVKPSGDRLMSTNCDATHFIACSGKIVINESYFEGMGDDVINVHTFYLTIKKIEGNKLYAKQQAESQDGILYVPNVGDTMNVVNPKTLLKYDTIVVSEVDFDEKTGICCITAQGDLPKDIAIDDCLCDVTEFATLQFTNCVANNLRGRGVLFSMDGAVVRNNKFINCTGEGILLPAGSGPWWEGAHASNIDIYDNEIIDCGNSQAKYCRSCGITVFTSADIPTPEIFENIRFYNNRIVGDISPIYIECVNGITVENNEISANGEIYIDNCNRVSLKGNKMI